MTEHVKHILILAAVIPAVLSVLLYLIAGRQTLRRPNLTLAALSVLLMGIALGVLMAGIVIVLFADTRQIPV
jgi:hypothetical protein